MLFPYLDTPKLITNSTGHIQWFRPGIIDITHKFDLTNYPFDIQNFKIILESWTNPAERIKLNLWTPASNTIQKEPKFVENKQWMLLDNIWSVKNTVNYPTASYDSINCYFSLKRQARSIMKMIFYPGVLITSLSICCYLLPMEGPVRVKFIS